jgi:hypothetical protein
MATFRKKIAHPITYVTTKSSYRSCTGRHFYGTENEIWAGFGLVGNTEKKLGADYEQLLMVVFSCFQGQENKLKCVLAYTTNT